MNRLSLTMGIGLIFLGALFLLVNMDILDSRIVITAIFTFIGIIFVLNPSIFRTTKDPSGKFKTLFIYAKGIEILGLIILLGSFLLGVLSMVGKLQIELLFLVLSIVGGFIVGISMVLTAQSILAILQIENNTRQNAKHFEAIRDLLQKSIAQS